MRLEQCTRLSLNSLKTIRKTEHLYTGLEIYYRTNTNVCRTKDIELRRNFKSIHLLCRTAVHAVFTMTMPLTEYFIRLERA